MLVGYCSPPTAQAMDWVYAASKQCKEDGRGSLHAFLLQQVSLSVSSRGQQRGEGRSVTCVAESHVEQHSTWYTVLLTSPQGCLHVRLS